MANVKNVLRGVFGKGFKDPGTIEAFAKKYTPEAPASIDLLTRISEDPQLVARYQEIAEPLGEDVEAILNAIGKEMYGEPAQSPKTAKAGVQNQTKPGAGKKPAATPEVVSEGPSDQPVVSTEEGTLATNVPDSNPAVVDNTLADPPPEVVAQDPIAATQTLQAMDAGIPPGASADDMQQLAGDPLDYQPSEPSSAPNDDMLRRLSAWQAGQETKRMAPTQQAMNDFAGWADEPQRLANEASKAAKTKQTVDDFFQWVNKTQGDDASQQAAADAATAANTQQAFDGLAGWADYRKPPISPETQQAMNDFAASADQPPPAPISPETQQAMNDFASQKVPVTKGLMDDQSGGELPPGWPSRTGTLIKSLLKYGAAGAATHGAVEYATSGKSAPADEDARKAQMNAILNGGN